MSHVLQHVPEFGKRRIRLIKQLPTVRVVSCKLRYHFCCLLSLIFQVIRLNFVVLDFDFGDSSLMLHQLNRVLCVLKLIGGILELASEPL